MELNFEVEALGEGNLRLSVLGAEDVLWPWPGARDGSAVFADEDVLSYLADAWPSLLLSETWPDIFEPSQEPRSMTGLLRAAEDRWEQMPDAEQAEVADEEAEIDTFLYRHEGRPAEGGARDVQPHGPGYQGRRLVSREAAAAE